MAKRKASTTTNEQQRERKRLQNRISQQCFREKQVSYVRHLEQFVESIEKSEGFGGTAPAERLRLIRENHVLRESLLQIRKKLLSLGAQVSSLANLDEVMPSPPTCEDERHMTPETALDECPQTYDDSIRQNTRLRSSPPPGYPTPLQLSTLELENEIQPSAQRSATILLSSVSPQELHQDKTNGRRSGLMDTDISTFFAADFVQFSPGVGIIVRRSAGVSTKSPLLVMEAKIQRAMAEFDPRTYHDALCIRSFVDDLSSEEVQEIEGQILSDIVHLAMKTLVKTSRIAGYGHVLCPTPIAERIMIWRVRPTAENRNAIDPPFRPTVLQQRFSDHHPAIDFVYWAELRDQLILCEEELEIGMVVHRWQMSSVVEYPQYKVAVSVLELFAYLINPGLMTMDHSNPSEVISIPLTDCTERDLTDELHGLLATYRLSCFQDRRLPPLMAKEYPLLDFTNVVTQYPVVSLAQFPMISNQAGGSPIT